MEVIAFTINDSMKPTPLPVSKSKYIAFQNKEIGGIWDRQDQFRKAERGKTSSIHSHSCHAYYYTFSSQSNIHQVFILSKIPR